MRTLVIAAVTAAFLLTAGAAAAMPDAAGDASSAPPPAASAPLPVDITPDPPTSIVQEVIQSAAGGTSIRYPSGCRTVDFYAEQKSFIFRSVVYRFHQVKHWCWRGGVVYDARTAWSFDGSATACLGTVYPANTWFFTWWGNKENSGHFSEQRAHVTNCVFHIGDWKEFYPDVKIWSYADGTYKVTTAN